VRLRYAIFACLALVAVNVCRCCAAEPAADKSTAGAPSTTGTIEGVVTYEADAKRPWRYARYYVKNAKRGELAEAVVSVRMRGVPSPPSKPTTAKIDQKDFQFEPELVAIRQGDSVTFTNSDTATHNVRATGDVANFNITMAAGGAGNTIKFAKAGGIRRPVEVGCVFHSNMRAWVFVFDHPFFAVTKADGKFRLADVPSGEYELELSHPAGGLKWKQKVTVKPGDTTNVAVKLSPTDAK
jgi:plastocyanin